MTPFTRGRETRRPGAAPLTLAASNESMPRRHTTKICCGMDVATAAPPPSGEILRVWSGAASTSCLPSAAANICDSADARPSRCALSVRSGTLTLPRSAQMRYCSGSRQSRTTTAGGDPDRLVSASLLPVRRRAAASSSTVAVCTGPLSSMLHAQEHCSEPSGPASCPSAVAAAAAGVAAPPSRNSMPCAASQVALQQQGGADQGEGQA
jgi:hypothetical protein